MAPNDQTTIASRTTLTELHQNTEGLGALAAEMAGLRVSFDAWARDTQTLSKKVEDHLAIPRWTPGQIKAAFAGAVLVITAMTPIVGRIFGSTVSEASAEERQKQSLAAERRYAEVADKGWEKRAEQMVATALAAQQANFQAWYAEREKERSTASGAARPARAPRLRAP